MSASIRRMFCRRKRTQRGMCPLSAYALATPCPVMTERMRVSPYALATPCPVLILPMALSGAVLPHVVTVVTSYKCSCDTSHTFVCSNPNSLAFYMRHVCSTPNPLPYICVVPQVCARTLPHVAQSLLHRPVEWRPAHLPPLQVTPAITA
eukprot:1486953-Rhodomonas_salina.2